MIFYSLRAMLLFYSPLALTMHCSHLVMKLLLCNMLTSCSIFGISQPSLLGFPRSRASWLIPRCHKILLKNIMLWEVGLRFKTRIWFLWIWILYHRTVFYGQYQCSGPGASEAGRVGWSHELSAAQAAAFSSVSFINGNQWLQTWFGTAIDRA